MRRALLLALAVLAVLAVPAGAQADPPDHGALVPALGAYLTLNGVDLAETLSLLGRQQGHEGNPVLAPLATHPVAFSAIKIASASAFVATVWQLHRTHPRLAWVLTGGGLVVETYATIHNAQLLRAPPR